MALSPFVIPRRSSRRRLLIAAALAGALAVAGVARARHPAAPSGHRSQREVIEVVLATPLPGPAVAPADDCPTALAAWGDARKAAHRSGVTEDDSALRPERERAIESCLAAR